PPARPPRPGPGSPARRCASTRRASAPPRGGTDARPARARAAPPPSLASAARGVGLAQGNPAVVQEGTVADEFEGLLVVGGPEQEVAAHHFLGFDVWPVHDGGTTVLQPDDLTALVREFFARDVPAAGAELADPGLVHLHLPLQLFRRQML